MLFKYNKFLICQNLSFLRQCISSGSIKMSEISKNELKRRQKSEKKEAEKKEKGVIEQTTEVDAATYYEQRKQFVLDMRAAGIESHPHKFHVDSSIADAVKMCNEVNDGEKTDKKVSIGGRVMSKRESGAKLVFIDLAFGDEKIQVIVRLNDYESPELYEKDKKDVKLGDQVGVIGYIGKSKNGENSIYASKVKLLSPCLRQMPHEHFGLKDKETRYRQRYLDLIFNNESRNRFIVRNKIIRYVRDFLDNYGFLEVETPTMNMIPGGATAKPFITYHNAFDQSMYMRVAPELYLKELVVGGFPRVYEIGKQWRNEDADLTHNPEFTTCEFYMAYADYDDLMKITETMLSGLVKELFGSLKIKYTLKDEEYEVDFTPPFKRIDLIGELEKTIGEKLPCPTKLESEESRLILDKLCTKFKVECPAPRTSARLLDKLVGEYIEEQCINPTFITNHPVVMSPLSKWHRSRPGLTERFECFMLKKEICNSYTELNCEIVQRERFEQQVKDKGAGDDEAMFLDETFLHALSYGLPPTGGWGLGIDRLTMFLTNTCNIKDVILFPAMKPDLNIAANKENKTS